MSMSPNSSVIVRRTIDLQYANKKRSTSIKWSVVNGAFLLVFAYDLSCKCAGYTTFLHYVEACVAGILAANLLQHLFRLLPSRATPITLTTTQQKLLGLTNADLDSSFRIQDPKDVNDLSRARTPSPEPFPFPLGVRCSPPSPPSPHSSHSPKSPHSQYSPQLRYSPQSLSQSHYSPQTSSSPYDRPVRDEFIADRSTLEDYLKQYEEHSMAESYISEGSFQQYLGPTGGSYQLSAPTPAAAVEERAAPGSPQLWRRLHLDPQKLTQFNLNLRLWINVTILERLVREMASIDEALSKHGLSDVKIGEVSIERLRKIGASGFSGTESVPALLPFLEPFPEQQYLVRRIKELSRGGCLSEYKWDGGGAHWDDAKPTDAELLLHLVATYLDGQIGPESGEPRPFSSHHVSAAPSPAPHGPDVLCIHRVTRRPPHYVLCAGTETLEVARGRNNLLHTLLLLIACCARKNPPALRRRHLGRAALNMLWIIGR